MKPSEAPIGAIAYAPCGCVLRKEEGGSQGSSYWSATTFCAKPGVDMCFFMPGEVEANRGVMHDKQHTASNVAWAKIVIDPLVNALMERFEP